MGACLSVAGLDAHTEEGGESYLSSMMCSLAPSLIESHFADLAVKALARPRGTDGRPAPTAPS